MTKLVILYELWEVVKPIAMVLVTAYAGLLAARLNAWLGLKAEGELRDALHKAAENGVSFAANRMGGSMTAILANGMVDKLVAQAADYVRGKNPKTLKKLKVDDGALADIIRSKIGKAR